MSDIQQPQVTVRMVTCMRDILQEVWFTESHWSQQTCTVHDLNKHGSAYLGFACLGFAHLGFAYLSTLFDLDMSCCGFRIEFYRSTLPHFAGLHCNDGGVCC